MDNDKKKILAERVRAREFTVAPGVYDMISARVADQMGFGALYMTGYGTVASLLGVPDAGLASYTEMLARAQQIAEGTVTPLIADADTGYGGLLNVRRTVRGYEMAGVAAIQIEDQVFPKKCGHTLGRKVVPLEEMVKKIQVAVDSRSSADFLVIARTDARTEHGLDEAMRRGEAYLEAGADILFLESPESEEEFERVGRNFDAPLLANMVEGGRSPVIDGERLKEFGFVIAIYPATGFCATAAVLEEAFAHLLKKGSSLGIEVPLYDAHRMHVLMGFEDVWEFERRYGD